MGGRKFYADSFPDGEQGFPLWERQKVDTWGTTVPHTSLPGRKWSSGFIIAAWVPESLALKQRDRAASPCSPQEAQGLEPVLNICKVAHKCYLTTDPAASISIMPGKLKRWAEGDWKLPFPLETQKVLRWIPEVRFLLHLLALYPCASHLWVCRIQVGII